MNTAVDFLSRTEVNLVEKLEMSIRNDIPTKAIGVNIQFTGVVEEEQFYILPDAKIEENQPWKNNVAEFQHFHKPTSCLNTCSECHFKDYTKIRLD